jgi:cell division protein ZapB
MDFLTYSWVMEADLKILEDKIIKLIALCASLREQNLALRQDLSQTKQDANQLKSNMQVASGRLALLLNNLPDTVTNQELDA